MTPNRESAIEVSALAAELLEGTTYTTGMVMDGANRGSEETKLIRGVNLLVATPARLLEHIRDTTSFVFKNLKSLVVYGADGFGSNRMLLRDILAELPKKTRVNSVLASHGSDELEGMIELVCRPNALHRFATEGSESVVSEGSKETQGYVVVEAEKRFLLLYSFLRKFQTKKIVVVAGESSSSCWGGSLDWGFGEVVGEEED